MNLKRLFTYPTPESLLVTREVAGHNLKLNIYIYIHYISYIIYVYIYDIYVHMYSMYCIVCMYVCMLCMYVCMDGWMYVCMYVCMYLWMYVFMCSLHLLTYTTYANHRNDGNLPFMILGDTCTHNSHFMGKCLSPHSVII